MNNRISKLFSCCLGNRVVIIETNFKEFHGQFKNIEPEGHSDRWFIDRFKEDSEFEYSLNGKKYYFQRLV